MSSNNKESLFTLYFNSSREERKKGVLDCQPKRDFAFTAPVFGGRAAYQESLVTARRTGGLVSTSRRLMVLFPIKVCSSLGDDEPIHIDIACAYALGPRLERFVEDDTGDDAFLIPFRTQTIGTLVEAFYDKQLSLARLDDALDLLQLCGFLGCEQVLSTCLDFYERQPRILLNPLTVLPAWDALSNVRSSLKALNEQMEARAGAESGGGAPPSPPRKVAGPLLDRLQALVERMRVFCAECFDTLAADTQSQAGTLPRDLLEQLLDSPELRCSSEALVLRFLTLWSKGPPPAPGQRRRTNDASLPDRLPIYFELVAKYVRLEVLPTENLGKLMEQHPELAPHVIAALTAKSRLADQLLLATAPDQVEHIRSSLPVRPVLSLPRTVHVELCHLRAFYQADCEPMFPASLMTYAFSIPGAPGLWYLRIDPFGKNDETKDAFISYFLYSVGFSGTIEAILTVEVPCWSFTGTKTLRMKGGSGQGAAKGIPLPPLAERYTDAMGDNDKIIFTLTISGISFGDDLPSSSPSTSAPTAPSSQLARAGSVPASGSIDLSVAQVSPRNPSAPRMGSVGPQAADASVPGVPPLDFRGLGLGGPVPGGPAPGGAAQGPAGHADGPLPSNAGAWDADMESNQSFSFAMQSHSKSHAPRGGAGAAVHGHGPNGVERGPGGLGRAILNRSPPRR